MNELPGLSSAASTSGISLDTSRLSNKANLAKAGKQFETIFTTMMLKSMRSAKLGDELFDSKALDTFREMQDGKVAAAMAEHAPLGIGKAVTDFLARSQAELQPESTRPASEGAPR